MTLEHRSKILTIYPNLDHSKQRLACFVRHLIKQAPASSQVAPTRPSKYVRPNFHAIHSLTSIADICGTVPMICTIYASCITGVPFLGCVWRLIDIRSWDRSVFRRMSGHDEINIIIAYVIHTYITRYSAESLFDIRANKRMMIQCKKF